mgnify:CR=1 FL=1|tara:strand:- start:2329 stop:3126 length:798 start_codon:yes stop_codon:yes gene_type:complete
MTIYIGHDDWVAEGKLDFLDDSVSGSYIASTSVAYPYHIYNAFKPDTATRAKVGLSSPAPLYFTNTSGLMPDYIGVACCRSLSEAASDVVFAEDFSTDAKSVTTDAFTLKTTQRPHNFIVETGNTLSGNNSLTIDPNAGFITFSNIRIGTLTPLETYGAGHIYFEAGATTHKTKNIYSDEGYQIATTSSNYPASFSIKIKNHSEAWFLQYYEKMVSDMAQRPFFLHDDTVTNGEAAYCWLTSAPGQAKMNSNGLFDITLSCKGYL